MCFLIVDEAENSCFGPHKFLPTYKIYIFYLKAAH